MRIYERSYPWYMCDWLPPSEDVELLLLLWRRSNSSPAGPCDISDRRSMGGCSSASEGLGSSLLILRGVSNSLSNADSYDRFMRSGLSTGEGFALLLLMLRRGSNSSSVADPCDRRLMGDGLSAGQGFELLLLALRGGSKSSSIAES